MDNINTKIRLKEIDYMKTISIFCLIIVHVYEELCDFNALNKIASSGHSLFGSTLEWINGTIGATMFMFCMGVGIIFSSRNDSTSLIKRGIRIFIIGKILNICRYLIPNFILSSLGINLFQVEPPVILFFECEIMEFAGLALITIGLFKKLNFNYCIMLMIALILQPIANILKNINCPNDLTTILLGQFVPTCKNSYFPLFMWLIFPVVGMIFGEGIKKIIDTRKTFYVYCIPLGIITIVSIMYSLNQFNITAKDLFSLTNNKAYHMLFLETFISIVMILIETGIFYFISEFFTNVKIVDNFVLYSSINLNKLFIVQWLIIPFIYVIMRILKMDLLNPKYILPVAIMIYILDYIIVGMFNKFKR